jgi:hypothetical protein
MLRKYFIILIFLLLGATAVLLSYSSRQPENNEKSSTQDRYTVLKSGEMMILETLERTLLFIVDK